MKEPAILVKKGYSTMYEIPISRTNRKIYHATCWKKYRFRNFAFIRSFRGVRSNSTLILFLDSFITFGVD